jgi:hypothetical protein
MRVDRLCMLLVAMMGKNNRVNSELNVEVAVGSGCHRC